MVDDYFDGIYAQVRPHPRENNFACLFTLPELKISDYLQGKIVRRGKFKYLI